MRTKFLDNASDRLNNALEAIGRFVTGTVSFDEARAYIRRTTENAREDAAQAAADNALLAPDRHETHKFLADSTHAFLAARTGNADKVLRSAPVTLPETLRALVNKHGYDACFDALEEAGLLEGVEYPGPGMYDL